MSFLSDNFLYGFRFNVTDVRYSFDFAASKWNGVLYWDDRVTTKFDPATKKSLVGQSEFGHAAEWWTRYSVVTLQPSDASHAPNLYVYRATNADATGTTGFFETASQTRAEEPIGPTHIRAEIAYRDDVAISDTGYGRFAALHELGHALGISHPGDDFGTNSLYDTDKTVMSYIVPGVGSILGKTVPQIEAGRLPVTPMPYDIAAIAELYGGMPNVNRTTSDEFSVANGQFKNSATAKFSQTIVDTGGTEKFDLSGYTLGSVTIDLREALDANDNWTDAKTIVGQQYTYIARGTVIEDAIGTGGNDILIGGYAANTLQGGGGNDKVYDPSNKAISGDWLYGDTIGATLEGGNDTLWGGSNTFLYGGPAANDNYPPLHEICTVNAR